MKVKFEDPFRYIIIKDETSSQKIDDVIIYHLLPPEGRNLPPIKLVDTPDFGDRDLEEDEKIFPKISDF